ncbi:MAG: helix-turn-helix domain-containing protein [Lachnospiraceae bacterium]
MLSRIFPKLILSDIKEAPQGDLSNEIITYIGKHFREEISLSTIAKHFGIGKCTLSRIFSNVLKVSFSTYINSLRIDYADHLLMTTDLGMMEISIECGYHNQQTFYRLFKTYHKCTPKEYRKEHRLRPVLALPPYTEVYEPQYGQESFTK